MGCTKTGHSQGAIPPGSANVESPVELPATLTAADTPTIFEPCGDAVRPVTGFWWMGRESRHRYTLLLKFHRSQTHSSAGIFIPWKRVVREARKAPGKSVTFSPPSNFEPKGRLILAMEWIHTPSLESQ